MVHAMRYPGYPGEYTLTIQLDKSGLPVLSGWGTLLGTINGYRLYEARQVYHAGKGSNNGIAVSYLAQKEKSLLRIVVETPYHGIHARRLATSIVKSMKEGGR